MTYLFNAQRRQPKRVPRRAQRVNLDPSEAKRYALELLRVHKVSPLADRVIDLLAVAGVLGESQLHSLLAVSPSSLLRYYKSHLVDRVPVNDLDLGRFGLSKREKVYALGMAGIAIAEMRAEGRPVPKGYLGYGVRRVTHELLTNEVVIRLAKYAASRGAEPIWRSKYEATVRDNKGKPELEPDALIEVGSRRFVIEYHNEDTARRARAKVKRYEDIARNGRWRDSWQTDTLPPVLVALTHRAVATGYQEAIKDEEWRGLRFRYLGKSWASFQRGDSPALWLDFRTGKVVDVLADGV